MFYAIRNTHLGVVCWSLEFILSHGLIKNFRFKTKIITTHIIQRIKNAVSGNSGITMAHYLQDC
jgi:hypothetical protein